MKARDALLIFVALLATYARSLPAEGRTKDWRIFTRAEGLVEDSCSLVTVGPTGDILVRHSNKTSPSILDGYDIFTVPAPGENRNQIYESPSGQLWTVASEGLMEFRETNWVLHPVREIAAQLRQSTNIPSLFPVRQGRVLVLLTDRLLQFDASPPANGNVETLQRADNWQLGSFNRMLPARDGGLWITAEHGVAKIIGPLRSLKSGGATNRLTPPLEMQLKNFTTLQENDSSGLTILAEHDGGEKVLVDLNGETWSVFPLSPSNVRSAWRSNGKIWIVTGDSHLELRSSQESPRRDGELPASRINDATVESDGTFWLATSDGLLRHTPSIWATSTTGAPPVKKPKIPAGPPEAATKQNDWRTALIARNSDTWLGAEHEIAWRHQNSWRIFSSTNQLGPEQVVRFVEAPDGRICCATPDKIWEFDGRNWLLLRTGFKRINGLASARDGTLWVATENGVHRSVRGAWVQNDVEDGLSSSNVTNISEDAAGRIFASTDRGISIFQPDADRDAPRTFVNSLANGEQSIREGIAARLSFGGKDKWNLTAVHRLLYSFRLDEREWSPFQDATEVTFTDLSIGKHYFQVRAMDRNANIDPQPARLEFSVVVPWYRETRLVWILAGALAVAIFFAGLAFNRHRKLRLSYAEVEKKIAERTSELEVANRELLHSQKMNALGTLAAGIAHDFNNILSIIKGSSQIIEENLDNPDKVRTRLDRIRTVVQQGAGIVEAMLGFSRNSGETAEAYDINIIVNDTLKLLGDRFLREVEINFAPGKDLPKTSVARDFVQQVLLNFIFNASEAMTDRKHINITTRHTKSLPPDLVLSPSAGNDYLVIAVKDSGSGISPENLPRIFEPFFTTKAMSTRRGTGLGLSMVYELARKMDAGIGVETVIGKGSTFTIFLPVRTPAVGQSKPQPSTLS